jgi:rhamnogalacturonyl hydrolase YesR
MDSTSHLLRVLITALLACPPALLQGQANLAPVDGKARLQDPALQTTRLIADKVLRETSFETRQVPLAFNGGIGSLHLAGTGSGSVMFARTRLRAEKEGEGWLGLAYAGQVRVFLNGKEVHAGDSPEASLREYTYNRYTFQEKLAVRWKAGENILLVKGRAGTSPLQLFAMPLNAIDEKEAGVNFFPPLEEQPHGVWLTCGPWPAPGGDPMARQFPPEEAYREVYATGQGWLGWEVPAVPMLQELVIPGGNSYLRDAYSDWHYANGGTMLAILSLHELSGDERYLDFVRGFANSLLSRRDYFRWQYEHLHAVRGSYHRLFRMTMLDDSGGPALPLAQLQGTGQGSEAMMEVLEQVHTYVTEGQERLEDRTFSRPEPEPATVWADDLFMSVPFLLRMAEITGDERLYDEVVRQVLQFNTYLADGETGLYFHGWYNERQETTPVLWGRANGWVVWATSEALLHLPKGHKGYKKVLKVYREHLAALAAVQDPSGMWHQVLDHPETFLESSCTAMFTLGMARGVRMGWLDNSYRERALKGWEALQAKILEDGTVIDICRGTGIGNDVDFYQQRKRFDHDPRGLGAMITAGCEISLLEAE